MYNRIISTQMIYFCHSHMIHLFPHTIQIFSGDLPIFAVIHTIHLFFMRLTVDSFIFTYDLHDSFIFTRHTHDAFISTRDSQRFIYFHM